MANVNQSPQTDQQPTSNPSRSNDSNQTPKQSDHRSTSGLAITGLVLGIIAVILSFIPIVNNVAAVIGVIGAIFAIIGIVKTGKKGKKKGRVMSIIATILCVLSVIITLSMQKSASDAFDKAEHDAGISTLSDQGDGNTKVQSVELQATATGKGTASWDAGGSSNTQDFNQKWSKKIDGKDAKGLLTLSAQPDYENSSDDQKVSCTILVNGKQKQHKEATGSAGTATCTIDFDN